MNSAEPQIDDEPAPAPATPVREFEIRPHEAANAWSIGRIEKDGTVERLAFGVSESGEAIGFAPIEAFSVEYVRASFGPGRYRINWRQMPEGTRKNYTLGFSELEIREAPRPLGAPPPRVQPTGVGRICQACGAEVTTRYCGNCATPAGSMRPAPIASSSSAPGFAELLAAMQAGISMAMQSTQSAAAIARTDVDRMRIEMEERARKYEADAKERLLENKQRHEKELQEREQFADKVAARAKSNDEIIAKIDHMIAERFEAMNARIDELEQDDDEEEEDDEPNDDDIVVEAEKPAVSSVWKEVLTHAVENVGPMVNAVGGAIADRIRASNGSTPHADSGSAEQAQSE
jgi:hypothetical protein